MRESISASDWLNFLRQEYLDTYIPSGGAAIKFPVPLDDGARAALFAELRSLEDNDQFQTFFVDAAETRVHMTDQIFFAIAKQVGWQDLAKRVVEKLIEEKGYSLPENYGPQMFVSVAQHNALDPQFFLGEVRRLLQNNVFYRRDLAKDFRVAMVQLCLGTAIGQREGVVMIDTITDWLTGANKSISAVKPYQIYNRIGRHNARHFLESLFRWILTAGYKGTLVALDIERLMMAKNPRDGTPFYTKAALLDAYEVLRQFIDSADRLSNALIIVVSNREFLDEDPLSRGMGAYEALKFRVFDEVRDRHLVNPMTALVRINGADSTKGER